MYEEKQEYMIRPKIWTGYRKGIKFGEACCNSSHFGIILPMYMDDIIVREEKLQMDGFGGGNHSTYIVYTLPKDLENVIMQMMADIPKKHHLPALDNPDTLVGMFGMEVFVGEVKSFSRKTKIQRHSECFRLNIYWEADGVAWSFGRVNTLMWNLRKMISKHIQSYKPVNYKRGKRKVLFERKVKCPQYFVDCDVKGNMTKLPF
jgi:hypothetical protein